MLDVGSLAASVGYVRDIYQGIVTKIRYNPVTAGDPATAKSFRQVSLLFKTNELYRLDAVMASETSAAESVIPLTANVFGIAPYGDAPFGDPTEKIRRVSPLHNDFGVCSQLTVGMSTCEANRRFELSGIAVEGAVDTEAGGYR